MAAVTTTATYMHSDVSSYSGSSSEEEGSGRSGSISRRVSFNDDEDGDDDYEDRHHPPPPVVLPLDCFYKKVLSDLLVSRNDSFFNYAFEQIFSRKLQANINGEQVSYDELRLHFLSLRRAYCDSHSSSSSSFSTLPHAASAFAPDGSVLKFGPFIANATNGGREGYLAAHTVVANLIDAHWESSPLLSSVPLASQSSPCLSSSSCSSSSSSSEGDAEDEKERDVELTPRRKRVRSSGGSMYHHHHYHHGLSSKGAHETVHHQVGSSRNHHHRIKYNALVVTDTMEIQWMEGKEGECRKITKFDRIIKRPTLSSTANKSSKFRRL